MAKRASEEKHSTFSTIRNDINDIHYEHLGATTDVSPNTPPTDEANL